MAYGNYIGEPTSTLVKREHFLDLGGFDERFCYMGDIEFWCRLLANNDLYYHPVPLCKFRYHEEQQSEKYKQDIDLLAREERWIREDFKIWALQSHMTGREQRQAEIQLGAHFLGRIWAKFKDKTIGLSKAINMALGELKFILLIQSLLFAIGHILRSRVKTLLFSKLSFLFKK